MSPVRVRPSQVHCGDRIRVIGVGLAEVRTEPRAAGWSADWGCPVWEFTTGVGEPWRQPEALPVEVWR